MVTMTKNDRVMVFIDVRNVIRGVQRECPGPFVVDFESMVKQLVGGRILRAAYCFDGKSCLENGKDCTAFHNNLKRNGFRVILRESYDSDEKKQKEVDMAMGCEIVLQAVKNSYDTALIISGDRDFVPAIEHIQEMGKTVEVAAFRSSKSSDLFYMADICHNLSSMPIIQMIVPDESKAKIEAAEENVAEATNDNALIEITEAI